MQASRPSTWTQNRPHIPSSTRQFKEHAHPEETPSARASRARPRRPTLSVTRQTNSAAFPHHHRLTVEALSSVSLSGMEDPFEVFRDFPFRHPLRA